MSLKVLAATAYWYYRRWGLKATVRRVLAELRLRVRSTESNGANDCSLDLIDIHDTPPINENFRKRIAVHAHVYYPDLVPELVGYLRHIPFAFDLFVSTPHCEAQAACEHAFTGLSRAHQVVVRLVANRGRDMAPMVSAFNRDLAEYDIVAHIHTKKSLYTRGRMAGWRGYLLSQLMGSEDQVRRIFGLFESDPKIGIVYPQNFHRFPYWGNTWLSNRNQGREWCRRLGIVDVPEGYFDYPAGSMFWARTAAIRGILDAGVALDDFPVEAGQTDGTLAHCLERMLVLAARRAGFQAAILRDIEHPSWSKWRFDHYLVRDRAQVESMLSTGDVKVVAFDIFDSLLIRPLLHPETTKAIVARRAGFSGDFVSLRASAESMARTRHGRDIGLNEIYSELSKLIQLPDDTVKRLRELEEEVERGAMMPRPDAISLMRHALACGKRVILLSDTFLPRSLIEPVLAENGIKDYGALYLSCDVGVRKDSGALYRLVLDKEGISPDALLMVGDNEHADLQIPMDLGIRTCHLLRPVELARAVPRFARVLERVRREGSLDEQITLGLVAQRLFKPLFYDRLDSSSLIRDGAEGIGYAIVGPIIFGYVQWLAARAKKDAIGKLYFLSREGQILKDVYDRMSEDMPGAVPSQYLVLSRRTVTVAMIESISDICNIALAPYSPNDLRSFIWYRFGVRLDADDLAEFDRCGAWPAGNPVEVKEGIQHLIPVLEALAKRIIARARIERAGLQVYLHQMGLNDGVSAALVDVGYSATIQDRLCELLGKGVYGYYLLTSAKSQLVCDRHGVFAEGYYGHHVVGGKGASPLWRLSFALETLLSSDDAQVAYYESVGERPPEPRFQTVSNDERGARTVRADIRRGVMAYVDDAVEIRRHVYPDFAGTTGLPEWLFEEFVEHMTDQERGTVAGLVLDDHYYGRDIVRWKGPDEASMS
jgi:FMN phosphatase YigB (HAD superfamily)